MILAVWQSLGTVHVPKLFDIESFPAVHHLVSTIRADLDSKYSATDLLRACFLEVQLLALQKCALCRSLKSWNRIDAQRIAAVSATSVEMAEWTPALPFVR